jgi:hypothetical protein
MKLKLNLLFNDLARRFGISKGLASRMYNSWMPVLAEKLQGLVTKVKKISFVIQVYNKEPQSVTILPFADSVPVPVIT